VTDILQILDGDALVAFTHIDLHWRVWDRGSRRVTLDWFLALGAIILIAAMAMVPYKVAAALR
jgi:hypothetical protein